MRTGAHIEVGALGAARSCSEVVVGGCGGARVRRDREWVRARGGQEMPRPGLRSSKSASARKGFADERRCGPGGGVGSWETIHFRNLSPPPESGSLSQDKGSHDLSTFATFAG